jgi:hypothetical protein
MLWILRWMILLGAHAQDVRDPSGRFAPPVWQGNPWGPAAARARAEGRLPSIVMTPAMTRWDQWGRAVLHDGDIVFRMGDSRTLSGFFPFSRFLAGASGSRYSHAGIVAIEDGSPVVYDCTKVGIRRQPFAVWTLDNFGPFGVKRLKPRWRQAIPGVLAYCRKVFEQQVPFDYSFDPDDSALYCLEMTEKAFRSQRLALSEPVLLGEMENATRYPICISLFVSLTPLVMKRPITLEQAVYMPGNGRHGVWASPLLEVVHSPSADRAIEDIPRQDGRLSLRGDLAIVACIANELRTGTRSHSRWGRLVLDLDSESRGHRSVRLTFFQPGLPVPRAGRRPLAGPVRPGSGPREAQPLAAEHEPDQAHAQEDHCGRLGNHGRHHCNQERLPLGAAGIGTDQPDLCQRFCGE